MIYEVNMAVFAIQNCLLKGLGLQCNETAHVTWSIMLKHLWSERDGERKSKEEQC